MGLFLTIAGFAQIGLGVIAWAVGVSAIHEQVAATLVGFGVVAVGLGAIHDKPRS